MTTSHLWSFSWGIARKIILIKHSVGGRWKHKTLSVKLTIILTTQAINRTFFLISAAINIIFFLLTKVTDYPLTVMHRNKISKIRVFSFRSFSRGSQMQIIFATKIASLNFLMKNLTKWPSHVCLLVIFVKSAW